MGRQLDMMKPENEQEFSIPGFQFINPNPNVEFNPFTMEASSSPVPNSRSTSTSIFGNPKKRIKTRQSPSRSIHTPKPICPELDFRFSGYAEKKHNLTGLGLGQPRQPHRRVFGEGFMDPGAEESIPTRLNRRTLLGGAVPDPEPVPVPKVKTNASSEQTIADPTLWSPFHRFYDAAKSKAPAQSTTTTSPMKTKIPSAAPGAGRNAQILNGTSRIRHPKRNLDIEESDDKDSFRFQIKSKGKEQLVAKFRSLFGITNEARTADISSDSSSTSYSSSCASSSTLASEDEEPVTISKPKRDQIRAPGTKKIQASPGAGLIEPPLPIPLPTTPRHPQIEFRSPAKVAPAPGIVSSPYQPIPITSPEQVPAELRKYWKQRYELFEKFDDGIQLDHESWYSVTPENIAHHIAARAAGTMPGNCGTILDAFAGCGGNTIQFAKFFDTVISIDIDPAKTAMARHNAKIYGVDSKIRFVTASFYDLAPHMTSGIDGIFLSPPWGGPAYNSKSTFKVADMNGWEIVELCRRVTPNLIIYCPRNIDKDELCRLAGPGAVVEIEENMFQGRPKAITAYFGEFVKVGK